nr:chain-length determining protein [Actinomyces oris]
MDPETLIIALRKNAVLVVMHVVLGTIIGTVFGLLTPAQYTSTANANLYVENGEANLPSTFNYLTSVMPTLVEIGTSESTFAEVSKNTGISQDELRRSVSVTSKTGTTLVEIRCTSTDPERAHKIAEAEMAALDSVARDLSSSGQAGNTTATLKVVDSPTTPSSPSSLSAVSTALIGTAIGLAAGAIMAILLYFLSQKNPQDKVEDPLLIIGRRRSREDA